jgi:hypothetical protein
MLRGDREDDEAAMLIGSEAAMLKTLVPSTS